MNTYLLVTFLHLTGFAYWLGGDLGVFHSSYWVANPDNPPEVRAAAAKILFWLDQVPRICMTMMLPTGLQLAWQAGLLGFGSPVMGAIWLAAFAWLAMVLYLHAASPSGTKTLLTRFDFWFRLALSLALLATSTLTIRRLSATRLELENTRDMWRGEAFPTTFWFPAVVAMSMGVVGAMISTSASGKMMAMWMPTAL